MNNYTLRVGIDISAQEVTAAWGTTPDAISQPLTVKQTPMGWQKLTTRLAQTGHCPAQVLVVMEATGSYWMRIAFHLHQAGFIVSVINPLQSRYFARLTLKIAKTDAIDARQLAHLGMLLEPPRWTPPPAIYHELQQRLAHRDALVSIRLQERNRLHALVQHQTVVASVQASLERHIQYLADEIHRLDTEIEALLEAPHEWHESALYLRSIPGIGANTAAWILTATLNFALCSAPEQVVAFAGLAPHPRQSGSSLHTTRAVGHGGHSRLRRALYMAALLATRFNPIIRRFYQRLLDQGKPKLVALCAAARKLLHLAWSVVTKRRFFDPAFGQLALSSTTHT